MNLRVSFKDFAKEHFPLKRLPAELSIRSTFNEVYRSSAGPFVKKITFDPKSNWTKWRQQVQMELDSQIELAAKFPDSVLPILNYAEDYQPMMMDLYIAYKCDSESYPFVELANRMGFDEKSKYDIAEKVVHIACILQESGK